ncbi:ribosomal-processing cysteine protease Prp [Carnobacterium gallinarum]|uniref:ribosomal-processing cysteine protease Prp n=1 Tax=Carnobacterium gallinarum TaxID=2749 RepID=UPI0005594308|nr:ribosomal-processing cysteine protease Prp [Carnobacterium gallinarum]
MIQASFKRNDEGNLVSFEITGHAESGPDGNDIVCAAVSALSFGATNSIEALAGFQPLVEMDEENGGELYVELIQEINREQLHIAQILLESLLLSVESIVEEYPEYVEMLK